MNEVVGSHDLLLRHARHPALRRGRGARGRRPHAEPGPRICPGGAGRSGTRPAASPTPPTRRSSPASCPRRPRPARTRGCSPPVPGQRDDRATAPASSTAPTWCPALAAAGYHTVCVGGVGFFNKPGPAGPRAARPVRREPLGAGVRRDLADLLRGPGGPRRAGRGRTARRSSGCSCSSTSPRCTSPTGSTCRAPPREAGDTRATHAAALAYVDRHIGRLFAAAEQSRRRCFAIVCSDHGTAYGEDGYTGHRLGHEVVWTVPYAEFVLEPR